MPFPRHADATAPVRRGIRRRCRRARTAAATLLAGLLLATPLLAHATNNVALFMTPSAGQVFAGGDSLVVAQEVAPVGEPGLGAFDIEVTYNANVLMLSVREGPFLSSTGNTTSCASTYLGPGDIRFACHAVGTPDHGPQGRGILAYYDVTPRISANSRPTDHNGIFTVMHNVVTTSTLKDVHGDPIPIVSVGDAIVVARLLEGDLNTDCVVNVVDDQMIASRYPAVFGLLAYSPHFDLEPASGDDDIDIKDLQFVFGRNRSTCESPIPPQTPPPGTTPTIPPTATSTPTGSATASPTHTSLPATATATPTTTATNATSTPTGSTTSTSAQTPTPTAVDTATPAPTESSVPTATPSRVSTVLAGTPTAAPSPPTGLPPTGFYGPTRGVHSPLGWLLTGLAVTALGVSLLWRNSRRRRREPC